MQITDEFIQELLYNINKIGIKESNIIAILQCGSSVYLTDVNDLDFKVIVKKYGKSANTLLDFKIKGHKVQCHYYTLNDWSAVKYYKVASHFIAEAEDMILVYGDDTNFHRHDMQDLANQRYLVDVWDRFFFNFNEADRTSYLFEDKRLWNFLLFAYKIIDGSSELTEHQRKALQDAHDLKSDKEDYRWLFEQVKRVTYERSIKDGRR